MPETTQRPQSAQRMPPPAFRATRAVPLGPRLTLTLVLVTALGLVAFGWPLLIEPGSVLDHDTAAPLILGAVLAAALVLTLVAVSDGGMDVRAVAMLGLLAAIGALIRPIAAGTGGVESALVLLVLAARVFGPGFGFVLGVLTLFTSALVTGGVGPWLPYQMIAAGWVGLGAGLLPRRAGRHPLRGAAELVLLAGYGAVASIAYGVVMNLSFWPYLAGTGTAASYVAGASVAENLGHFLAYTVVTSLGWDVTRAITTVVGVAMLGHVVLTTLRRAARRAVFADALPAHEGVH